MPKFEITFENTITYQMEISAKNKEEAEEKFNEKILKLTGKEIQELIYEESCYEFIDCEKI